MFVSLSTSEFEGQYGQLIVHNPQSGKYLVKLFARIDYANLDKLFRENKQVSQRLVNTLMRRDYRAPCSPFDLEFFRSRGTPLASHSLVISGQTVEMVMWDGNCFFGRFCYKNFTDDDFKLATNMPEETYHEFANNVAFFEKNIDTFIENMNKSVAGQGQQGQYHPLTGPLSHCLAKVWPTLPLLTPVPKRPIELMLLPDPAEMRQVMQEKLKDKDWVEGGSTASSWDRLQHDLNILVWEGKPSHRGINMIQNCYYGGFFRACCAAESHHAKTERMAAILRQAAKY